jgi:hypothetical protein
MIEQDGLVFSELCGDILDPDCASVVASGLFDNFKGDIHLMKEPI